ncbi:ClpP/crotonase-like domain-containing protein [Gaertneriomyces semiglobifer]|nr:ClpP/crotonase-like domain-containing protein [Gaertneriomyces semiglobifer]
MSSIVPAYAQYSTFRVTSPAEYVYHVAINRPKQLNSMNVLFWKECREIFNQIRTDNDVRAVVLSGGDCKLFTAGLDLTEFGPILSGDSQDPARYALKLQPMILDMQASFTAIETCLKPVIAAIHGACIGGGIDMITACDIRYSTPTALFSIKEVDIGLAADIGTLQRFPKVVGNASWARELAYTGRQFGAEEALKFGLISRICETREAVVEGALQTAKEIARKSPIAVTGTKHILNHARDHSVEESLRYVALWNSAMLNTQDIPIAVTATLAKKTPVYPKL